MILRELAAGSMTWMTCVALALSSSALIFGGPLAPLVPYGVTAALIGYAVSTIILSVFGSFRFGIGGPDSPSSAVLGSMVGAVGLDLAGSRSLVPTVMVAMAAAGLILGACFFAIGVLRGSRWTRYLPYPVVAGFMATAGWYVCSGAARVVTGQSLTFANVHVFASVDPLGRLAIAVAWSAVMIATQRRWRSPLALPLLLVAGTAAFYVFLLVAHVSPEVAREREWLFAVPSQTMWWFPWNPSALALVDPMALLRNALEVVPILVIATISLLAYESALELQSEHEPDLDREMRANGAAVFVSACLGGVLTYLSLGRTSMNYRSGARTRLSSFVVAALCLALLAAGVGIISDVPEFLIGGLLLQTGIPMLWSAVVSERRKLSVTDYAAVVAIWQISVWLGFAFGFVAGLLICCVIFAVRYASVSSVKTFGDARTIRSRLQRPAREIEILDREGEKIAVFILQSYLFFGTVDRLYQLTKAAAASEAAPLYLAFDFQNVSGIDSSAIPTFAKIRRAAAERGMTLVLSGMGPFFDRLWFAEHVKAASAVEIFPDLDHALEWCEGSLIARVREPARDAKTLTEFLAGGLDDPAAAARIRPYISSRVLARGDVLCREGDPADTIFYVQFGRLGVFSGEGAQRLRSLGGETVVGEMGFYRNVPRSATLIAEETTAIEELSRASLGRIEADAPSVAMAFHRVIIRVIADRLAFQNDLIAMLNR